MEISKLYIQKYTIIIELLQINAQIKDKGNNKIIIIITFVCVVIYLPSLLKII